jgi:protein O-GlcNAc transferase
MTPVTIDQAILVAQHHHEAGRLGEAEKIYRQVLAQQPDHAVALLLLGMLAGRAGRLEMAVELIRRSAQFEPDRAEAHGNLGNFLKDLGQLDEAIASYREAIRLKPDLVAAHSNLGNALRGQRRTDEAIASYQQAIRLKPDFAEVHSHLGIALMDTGKFDEAIAAFKQAIQFQPDLAVAYNNLGVALKSTGQIDEAVAAFGQAVRLRPDHAYAHSNLVYALPLHPAYDDGMIQEELRRWNKQHAEPLGRFIRPHTNNRDPDRRLRIGYVSPDFRDHVVGQNLLPLLREHDRGQVEIFCYANMAEGDALTEQIRNHADTWRRILRLSDLQAVELIQRDRIDILVDLALHTGTNRLLIFARKPAPVQVTYLGYCASTGLETMDYRLSDPHLDPPDSDLSHYTERTTRLPETYWCYAPVDLTPEPSPPPVEETGHITFGCLNNFAKVSPALDLWAEILQNVPGSHLIVHSHPGAHLKTVRERFADKNISPDRLEFLGRQVRAEYLKTYGRIDIALDPFPWGGGITTCDALWMGVPVVSLVGRTAVGRGGASILANIGLQELIAHTPEQYVKIAVGLANDLPRLAELRRTLRPRMQASPLMDAPRFARNVEATYRQMWRSWCAERGNSGLQSSVT